MQKVEGEEDELVLFRFADHRSETIEFGRAISIGNDELTVEHRGAATKPRECRCEALMLIGPLQATPAVQPHLVTIFHDLKSIAVELQLMQPRLLSRWFSRRRRNAWRDKPRSLWACSGLVERTMLPFQDCLAKLRYRPRRVVGQGDEVGRGKPGRMTFEFGDRAQRTVRHQLKDDFLFICKSEIHGTTSGKRLLAAQMAVARRSKYPRFGGVL